MRVPDHSTAFLVFIVGCMLSTARIVWEAPRLNTPPDSAQGVARRSDQRFGALKALLPERGVVGYLGETGAAALGDYYLTQYALAPVVVDSSPNHRLVVGNFTGSQTGSPALGPRSENLRIVKDFGDGVLLLANEGAN